MKVGGIDPQLLSACIHCGLCLPACPTYVATGREMESPRGRIYLLNLFQSEQEELTDRMREHLESCLGCLGCQTACPSGVQYGSILDQARPLLAEKRAAPVRKLMRFSFAKVLPNYPLLRRLGQLLRLWQGMNGRALIEKIVPPVQLRAAASDGAGHVSDRPVSLLKKMVTAESFLPPVPKFVPLPWKSWKPGPKLGTVQLFGGCVMDIFYNHVNHAAVRLLNRQSQVVEVPAQTCCGALAFHAGEEDITRRLAAENIAFFEKCDGPILVTSAGCGAMLKHYDRLFAGDGEMHEKAVEFSRRVKDVTEFLSEHEFSGHDVTAVAPHAVAYHAACHLAHAQGVRSAPEKLLKDLVENSSNRLIALQEAEHCCGSAGIFNVTNPDMSLKVLERKMQNIKATGADVVVTTNPGCLLQLEYGSRQCAPQVRVCHLVQFLDECMSSSDEEEEGMRA